MSRSHTKKHYIDVVHKLISNLGMDDTIDIGGHHNKP